MKSGGHRFVLSILTVAIALLTGLGLVTSPVVYATPEDETTTEATETADTTQNQNETGGDDNTEENEAAEEDIEEDSCEAGSFGFGWILCPGQNLITTAVNMFLTMISNSLEWTMITDKADAIQDIWQDFLTIANIVFAIAFLVMIYSMATSTGLSNYDIKKMLPRLIVVAIAVNLSFYICAALVDLSNIAGRGVYDLLTSYMEGAGAQNLLANSIASVVGLAGAAIAVVFLGGAAIIGVIIIVLAITFRQLALTILVIISPVALTLYMLPNTEKWAKKWFDMFTRMLLVYPMFMAVWGTSQLVSYISANVGGSIPFITDVLCAVAPALAILPLFKASGGLMGTVTKAMQGSSAAKKSSAAATSAIQRSRMVSGGRHLASSAALAAQNRFGDTRVIGGVFRGNAANRLVNYNQDFAAEQDKKAMASAENWVKGLKSEQRTSLATQGFYLDHKKRRVTVTDTHKLRANLAAVKDDLDASQWRDAMQYATTRSAYLAKRGRGNEAAQLRSAFATNALASKAMVISGGAIGGFIDNKDDYWNDSTFDARYGQAVAGYAAGLSPKKLSDMKADSIEHMRHAMYDGAAKANLLDKEQADAEKAFTDGASNLRATSQAVANDPKLMSGVNKKARGQLEINSEMRNLDQQRLAAAKNLDSLYQSYNDSFKKYADASKNDDNNGRIIAARELYGLAARARTIQSSNDYNSLSKNDKNNIQQIVSCQPNTIPAPIKSW